MRNLGLAVGAAAALLFAATAWSAESEQAAGTPVLAPLWVQQIEDGAACDAGHLPYAQQAAAPGQVQHDGAGNTFVHANGTLRSYTAEGMPRWSAPPCPGCTTPDDRGGLTRFHAMSSGDVWALEARTNGHGTSDSSFASLHHFAGDGEIVQTHPLAGTPFAAQGTLLLATVQGAVLVVIVDHVLHVLRMQDGVATTVALPVASDRDTTQAMAATLVGDGDIVVAVLGHDDDICFPGVPSCGIDALSMLRLSANDALVWRRDLLTSNTELTFSPDGTAYFFDASGQLVSVAADGNVIRTTLAPDVHVTSVYGIAGPGDGYLLVGSEELVSVDLAGRAGGRIAPDEDPYRYPWQPRLAQRSSEGFVVPLVMDAHCHAAAVYVPSTLAERYRLHVEGTTCVNDPNSLESPLTHNAIGVMANGGVTLLREECGEDSEPTLLAHFGLPGTLAGGLMMRDGFERLSQ